MKRKLVSARRRYVVALLARPCVIVLAAALVIEIWSHWQLWFAAITLLVLLSVAALRLKGRFPSLYKMAQILDRRAGLRDAVSTAWFLSQQPRYVENPNAVAHIAEADRRLGQVVLRTLFPLPRTSIAGAVSLAMLLIIAGTGRTPSTNKATGIAGLSHHDVLRPSMSASDADIASEAKPGQEAAILGNADAAGDVASGVASSPFIQSHERTAAPDMEAEHSSLQSGLDQASPPAGSREKAGSTPGPAASSGETVQNDHRRDPSAESHDNTAHSFVSQLLSPLKRMFGSNQGKENNTRANSEAETATAPATSKQAAEKDPQSTVAVSPDQRPALPNGAQYGSADASQKQAASRKPTALPSSIATTTVRPAADPATTIAARSNPEAIGMNPEGDRGHTRVQSMRGAAAPAHTVAFHFTHRGDAAGVTARDEVPLAYRTSVQAYMQEKPF